MVQPAALTPEAAAAWLRASAAVRAPKVVELIAGGRMPFNVTRNHYLVLRDLGLLEFPAAPAATFALAEDLALVPGEELVLTV